MFFCCDGWGVHICSINSSLVKTPTNTQKLHQGHFLHKDEKKNDNIVEKDSKKKCDVCKFEKEKDQVKQHSLKEHKFMLCLNCDKNIEFKEILLTNNFDMKDYLSVKFRDMSLEEIAKMVSY